MRRGLTPVVSIVLLVLLLMGIAASAFVFITQFMQEQQAEAVQSRLQFRSFEEDCTLSSLRAVFSNTAGENLTKADFDVLVNAEPQYFLLDPEPVPPGEIGRMTVPYFNGPSTVDLTIGYNYERTHTTWWRCEKQGLSKAGFVAWPNDDDAHWAVYDYRHENYTLHASYDGDLAAEDGPVTGDVPTVSGTDAYTIQEERSSWEDRPVDSPIILVENPQPNEDWTFNWTDPHDTFRFFLPGVEDAAQGYLVFWEDLYNPFDPPEYTDDWKDHVVRVTYIPPNLYRVAPLMAKGGYKHQFYVSTTTADPLTGNNPYNKSSGEWIANMDEPYYTENNVYLVPAG